MLNMLFSSKHYKRKLNRESKFKLPDIAISSSIVFTNYHTHQYNITSKQESLSQMLKKLHYYYYYQLSHYQLNLVMTEEAHPEVNNNQYTLKIGNSNTILFEYISYCTLVIVLV